MLRCPAHVESLEPYVDGVNLQFEASCPVSAMSSPENVRRLFILAELEWPGLDQQSVVRLFVG